jgi:serine O-acetyltransferase
VPDSSVSFDLPTVVAELRALRERWRQLQHRPREPGGRELPSRDALKDIVAGLRGALFPMRLGPADLRQDSEDYYIGHTLDTVLHALVAQVRLELRHAARHGIEGTPDFGDSELHGQKPAGIEQRAVTLVRDFAALLPRIRELLDTDVQAAYHGDPAARSVDEVLLCYPGIEAMIHHRIAHGLYRLGVPLLARIVAEEAHGQTGIDIHPGARIGAGFFIDHGTGVVIGETTVIGERVRIYQGVTLGALSVPRASARPAPGARRHPTIEDDVVIYAGATILGGETVIGKGAVIGGNAWVTTSVAPGARVAGAVGRGREPSPEIVAARTS